MTLYEKYKWSVSIRDYLESLEYDRSPPQLEALIPDKKQDVIRSLSNVAICYYLLAALRESEKYGRQCVLAVMDYYYGDWKEKVATDLGTRDPEWWRSHAAWIDFFRVGLSWALIMGDWSSAEKIASYPINDCKIDASYTKEDKALYLALACLVLKRENKDYALYLNIIETGKKEKTRLVAKVITSLQLRDQIGFQIGLEAYLGYFAKREFKKNVLDRLLCFDGTILLNIGRRKSLSFKVPSDVKDYLLFLK